MQRYDQIPTGCKVGNGIGLCVYFALIAGGVVVYIKYVVSHDEATAAAAKYEIITNNDKKQKDEISGYAYEEDVPALHRVEDDSKEETQT